LLAFIAAESREFDGFLANAERVERLDWPVDFARRIWRRGEAAILAANGPGPKLAARAAAVAREKVELTGLVSTGFCGGLDAALQPCDIFVASEVAGPDLRFPAKTPAFDGSAGIKSGVLLSVDRVASDAQEKSELRRSGAAAVEMEAAGVASKAMEWNIPFFCVRVVTDTADESLPLDFNRLRDEEGRFSRSRIIGAALRRPAVFPGLMRLDSRTKKAARVLGDFVASCRF